MQVKKFEAKTMKEALQLVKQELGPDAIILNAKDNKKSFGLGGSGSIEVTAAISDTAMKRKNYAESRMPEEDRGKFRNKSARHQKAFIDSTLNKYQQRRESAERAITTPLTPPSSYVGTPSTSLGVRPPTSRRYADIFDEETNESQQVVGRRANSVLDDYAKSGSYLLEDAANRKSTNENEVVALRKEVDALKNLLSQFQSHNSNQNQNGNSPRFQMNGADFENTGGWQTVGPNQNVNWNPNGNQMRQPVTVHPGAEFGLSFELSASFEKLQNAGIDTRFIVEILEKAEKELTGLEKKKRGLVDAWVARYILSHTSVSGSWEKGTATTSAQPFGHFPKLHVFVGPNGHGKTASLVKMAGQMVLQEKKRVAIFSADTFKVGAADQLKIYAQILNVPFETIKHSVEFPNLCAKYRDFDFIFVDYPGFSLKDISEMDQVRALLPAKEISRTTHLVLSCGTKEIDAYEACHRYQITHFDDLLVTKLDESSAHGFLYNIQRKTEKPLYAFGVGSKIPEDIELATRERVVDLIYKITKKNL